MNADPKKSSDVTNEAEPTAAMTAMPVWLVALMVTLLFLIFTEVGSSRRFSPPTFPWRMYSGFNPRPVGLRKQLHAVKNCFPTTARSVTWKRAWAILRMVVLHWLIQNG